MTTIKKLLRILESSSKLQVATGSRVGFYKPGSSGSYGPLSDQVYDIEGLLKSFTPDSDGYVCLLEFGTNAGKLDDFKVTKNISNTEGDAFTEKLKKGTYNGSTFVEQEIIWDEDDVEYTYFGDPFKILKNSKFDYLNLKNNSTIKRELEKKESD